MESIMANAVCFICGKPYDAPAVNHRTICPPCVEHSKAYNHTPEEAAEINAFYAKKAEIDAAGAPPQALDLVLSCHVCNDDVTVTVEVNPHAATRVGHVYCSETCADSDPDSEWESEHDEDEEIAHVRSPFTSDSEDDCPF
jgi:hypothetical protein